MAIVNPKILTGPTQIVQRATYLAADSVTWKKGQIAYMTSGTLTPISTTTGGVTGPYFHLDDDQTTSTSTTYVKATRLEPGTEMEIYVQNGASAATIGVANLGLKYGLYGNTNTTVLDVGVTSNADWEVKRLAADYEPVKHLTADSPGVCVVILR